MYERMRPQAGAPSDERLDHEVKARRNALPRAQLRLTVGRVDDPAEREADALASEIVRRLRDGDAGRREPNATASRIQRATTPDLLGGGEVAAESEHRLRSSTGVGTPASGSAGVLGRMERAFGADFGGVRIRTGADVDVAAAGLQARAFTVGGDVYVKRNEYRPGTGAGDELLAHELAHTLQQGGSRIRRRADPLGAAEPVVVRQRIRGAHVSFKKEKMHLDFVRMKRMDPQYSKIIGKMVGIDVGEEQSGGTYGHWWTEIGDLDPITNEFDYKQSYGWWPKDGVSGVGETFGGVEGALNAGDAQDPHAGEVAPTEFHPVMEVDTAKETYDQIRKRVTQKIDTVAKAYTGKWHWRLGWGKNCHTFQQHLKTKADVHYQKSKKWLYDPTAMALAQQKQQARQQDQDRRDAIKALATKWYRVSAVSVTVVDLTTLVERSIETGAKIGPTGKAGKDATGFDCVEIVTDEGEQGWILKSDFKTHTGQDWAP
jgi:Domain of unknown function (DUF4157)